jgi:DNA-binding NarL/FixJ family response regulator
LAGGGVALAGVTRPPTAAGVTLAPPRPENLTGRQAEVLALLAAGLSNKQIAAELYLSTATVERHLATIYRNLGLGGRVEAARFAMENGLAGQPRNRTVL